MWWQVCLKIDGIRKRLKKNANHTGFVTRGGNQMSKVILMDFFAEWCGPCKMQDPINEEIKKKFGDRIEFKKIDVDTDQELAIKYTIHAVPTLILEKDGVLFKRYTGVTRANVLEADINAALK